MADDGDRRRMTAIGKRLESWGVEVRWMPGWETRGATWARVPVGIIDHHDASSTRSGEWGALGYIVDNGLAQFQVGRCLDGVPRVAICAAGRQAHAGVGGWRFPDGVTVPTNQGNAWLYGAEKANSGNEKATEAADYAADALFAAVLAECGDLPAHRVIGHKEYGNTPPGGWKGRKQDPAYDMGWRRNRVANFTPRTSEEDDMQITELYAARDAEGRNFLDFQNFMTGTMAEFARRDAAQAAQITGLSAAVTALAAGVDGVDADELKAHISTEVDRAMGEFRERVAEGYDVKLEPKDGA